MPEVTILLCGPPRLAYAAHPIALQRQKALALVAYLALAREPVSRDELASLFWPDLSQERARAALRTTLPALTQAAPIAWIAADRRAVQLVPAAVTIDALRFAGLIAEVRGHAHERPLHCPACRARLRAAADLYRGDFLQGFHLAAAPDFETWHLTQREALRHEMAWVLRMLTDPQDRIDGIVDATVVRDAQRWIEIDPLNETAHHTLMELFAAQGRRADALRQYHACAALLQAELGVAPAPETRALYEGLAHSADTTTRSDAALRYELRNTLPAEPGGFVGRDAEVRQVTAYLGDPDCRLVTITGPGGIGKTRLALRAAALLQTHFSHGACFVPLSEARTPAEAFRYIAAAVDPTALSTDAPVAVARNVLAHRELLLVLDNLEHLVEAALELLELLAAAPGVKLLVTSRERLAVRAEYVLPLGGLAVPPAQSPSAGSFDAVRLFVQRARQVQPEFSLTPGSEAAIVEICTLLAGMPLGIELAAAAIRTFSPAAIAAAIAQSPDFLRASVRDLPERQRSLRAVFWHSWHLLTPAEQACFARLSVFRGGFAIAAAQQVAAADRELLTTLEAKSLLRCDPDERYDFHPLLHQYAAEQLAANPDEAATVQARHADYIAQMLTHIEPVLASGDHLSRLARDAANIRAAWFWAADAGASAVLGAMVDGLARFCELRSYRQEADAALAYAARRLEALPLTAPREQRVLAQVLAWRGHFCQFLGRYDEAATLLERSLDLAARLNDQALLAFGAKAQGINANARGDHRQALVLHQASLERYQHLGDVAGIGEVYNRMGGAAYDMGDLREAQRCWQASLAAYTERNDLWGTARALNNLGEAARILGDYAEARRLAEESLALSAALGPFWSISPTNNLAQVARLEGRYAEARQLHEQSLAACHAVGDVRGAANTTFFLGELELAVGQIAAAEERLTVALNSYRAAGQRHGVSACLIALAEAALARGDYPAAAALAREGLTLAEATAARITVGRALSALGIALRRSGDEAAGAAALAEAERLLAALGASADAQLAAHRRRSAARSAE